MEHRAPAYIPGPPPLPDLHRHAFFLDVDGTLVSFERSPEAVTVDPAVLSLLLRLEQRSAGALALITGRTIASLDRLTAPHRFAAAGIHGLERRSARSVHASSVASHAMEQVRAALRALAQEHPQLLLEDKGSGLALHFRAVPQLAARAIARVLELVRPYPDLKVQQGHMVVEVLPRTAGKQHALAAFMAQAPFRGRTPLFVGDDLTDEPAFEWVNAAGGLSVAVAVTRPTAASTQLSSVAAVHAWLERAAAGEGS
jgi:trehalose 6-phosphate phosphatase